MLLAIVLQGLLRPRLPADRPAALVENQDTKYQFDRKVGYIASHQL